MSEESKLNILVAYPYLKPDVIGPLAANHSDIRFLLDSGAFTAWKLKKPIQLDDYCRFIESLPFRPWRYFTLDVIGDPHGTIKNYEIMLKRGFTPVPIFTRGESPSVLEDYYKTSDVVGIGGLVGTPGNKGFVKAIMKKVNGRKVHWLGFNAKEFLAHYKPYMCDSSSWSSSYRFASGQVYDKNGQWVRIEKKLFSEKPNTRTLELIQSHGVDPHLLAKTEEWRNLRAEKISTILTLTSRTWVKYQQDLKRKLGTNFFLACAATGDVDLMISAYKFWKGQK